MPAQAIWPSPPQTGVSRQRRSPGSRSHTAVGALRSVEDGTRLADRAPAPAPRPGTADLRGRLRRLLRARGRRARAPGRPGISAPGRPPRRATAALAGRPVAEIAPDQAAALRRLRAAFGFVEILRVVDHNEIQDQDDDQLTEEGQQGPPADW